MKVIIDRFEEEYAVIEMDGEILKAPRALFGDAREGDMIRIENLGRAARQVDEEPHSIFERLRRRSRARRNRHRAREGKPHDC